MSYPKIFRIPVPVFTNTRGKHYLTLKQVTELLDGNIVIEEKVDGKQSARKVNDYTVVWYEDTRYKHTIFYDNLPSFDIVFDVERDGRFLNFTEKMNFCADYGLNRSPSIFCGRTSYEELLRYLPNLLNVQSIFGQSKIEGIVIKNYDKQLFGKIVNPEFEEEIDSGEHWTKKKLVKNIMRVK